MMYDYIQTYNRWKSRRRKKRFLLTLLFIAPLIPLGYAFFIEKRTYPLFTQRSQPKNNSIANIILPDRSFEKRIATYHSSKSVPDTNETNESKKEEKRKSEEKRSKKALLRSSVTDTQQLIEKFTQRPNPHTAILIARLFMDAKEYKKAKEWALKANELDPTLEESWLLYAKSLSAMGEVQKAQAALKSYISQSGSKKATILLQQLKKENQ